MGDRLGRGQHVDLHDLGLVQDLVGQAADVGRHGGREEERLALGRQLPEDAADVGQEAHVAHAVGLVQHQHLDVGEVDGLVAQQVEQASGAGDDDLCAAIELLDLGPLADAAVDGDAADAGAAAQLGGGLVDLLGQLAGRRHDQHADLAHRPFGQALQDGQHEGCGLAGAGLGQAQHVAP